jgi:YHS domain-containing protein
MKLFFRVKNVIAAAAIALGVLSASASAESLTKVEAKRVCMMNNSVFPNDQIPTAVDGKTYYGCCPMCAGRLKAEDSLRHAVDPVSGKQVDKALAVIGADSKGKAFYFENEQNLRAFATKG